MDTVDPGRGIKPTLDADGEVLRSDGTTILGGDCKAGLAIALEGLTSAIEDGGPRRSVQVVFSRAEEGGLNGARNLDFSLINAKSGMVFDGEGPVSRICVSAPAQNIVQCHVTGVAAHAGLEPENGTSALLVAANILTRLPLGRIDDETTSNIGVLNGGLKRNIVPESAYMDGELRSQEPNQAGQLHRRNPPRLRPSRRPVSPGNHRPQHLEPIPALTKLMRRTLRPSDDIARKPLPPSALTPSMETTGGGSDANVFFEHGIAALPVGIGVRDFHTTRETARISEIMDGARVCQAYLSAL